MSLDHHEGRREGSQEGKSRESYRVVGMLAGADMINDTALLRHSAMKKLFAGTYAPSTLGSCLWAFTFGHVRQLDAVACRSLVNLAALSPIVAGIDDYAVVDIDKSIKEVHG